MKSLDDIALGLGEFIMDAHGGNLFTPIEVSFVNNDGTSASIWVVQTRSNQYAFDVHAEAVRFCNTISEKNK